MNRAADILCVLVIAVAVAVVTGWIAGWSRVAAILPAKWVPMQFTTACGFVLAGIAVLKTRVKFHIRRTIIAEGCAMLLLIMIGEIALSQLLGFGGMKTALPATADLPHQTAEGMPSVGTMMGFVIASFAVAVGLHHGWSCQWYLASGGGVFTIGVVGIVGYLMNDPAFAFEGKHSTGMAILTALSFAALGLAMAQRGSLAIRRAKAE